VSFAVQMLRQRRGRKSLGYKVLGDKVSQSIFVRLRERYVGRHVVSSVLENKVLLIIMRVSWRRVRKHCVP
jgi:hypothetical protein